MANNSDVRYSNDNVGKSATAQLFPWEKPVPVSKFWDSFDYCISRNFLSNFTGPELEKLPIDSDSTASHEDKLKLLLHLVQEKLKNEEAAAVEKSPGGLYDTNYECWNSLWQSTYTLQSELGLLTDAEHTLRQLVDRRPNKANNFIPLHMLADHLILTGQYAEAETTERPVCAWMDAHAGLGKHSPQAINARRIIARALWMQGPSRRGEAEAMVAEIGVLTEEMADEGCPFGVYREEERRLTEKMMAELEKAG